jgi:hypothetical protein
MELGFSRSSARNSISASTESSAWRAKNASAEPVMMSGGGGGWSLGGSFQVLPLQILLAEEHQVRGDAEDSRRALGALHLAAHPVNPAGNPGQHQSTTQVSLVPPP